MGWTLVTGGAKRLGAELCVACAKSGHDVLVHYRSSKNEAESVAEKCRALGVNAEIIQGDFSHGIREFVASLPELQNLINNVGEFTLNSLTECSLDEYYELFQANLHAPFEIIHGSVITKNIINIGVSGIDNSYAPLYSLTKEALLHLTKQLAREYASKGVRVNMVSPGQLDNSVDLTSTIPMGRPGSLSEVSRIVTLLLDPKSSYITGQNIEVAGGLGL